MSHEIGATIGVPPNVIATGLKGYVWRVQSADIDTGVTMYRAQVTGNVTDDGEVEVVIVGLDE